VAGASGVAGTGAPMSGAAGTSTGAAGTSVSAAGTAAVAAAGSGASGAAAAGTTGASGAPAANGGNTMGEVTVTFTTATYGGQYAPLNYGAVWFEKPDGTFIKTSKRWAGTIHAGDLAAWTKASGGWGSAFGGGSPDQMDALSSATLRTHQMHSVTWNLKDVDKNLIPDGDYVALVEVTESRARDRAGPLLKIPFTKGPNPQNVDVPDAPSFTGVTLRFQPQ